MGTKFAPFRANGQAKSKPHAHNKGQRWYLRREFQRAKGKKA